MSEGIKRILTAAVGVPLILGLIWVGSWPFALFVAAVALAGQYEYLGLIRSAGVPVVRWVPLVAGALMLSRFFVDWGPGPTVLGVLLLVLMTLRGSVNDAIARLTGALSSLIYPVMLIAFLHDIRQLADTLIGSEPFLLMLLLFGLIWVTDSGAYYTGRAIGKTKFAPQTSPNKTWEGTIGGLVAAMILGAVFKMVWLPFLSWLDVAVLGLIGGFLAQYGDLLESSLKRSAGVKDSSSLLPGHGGVLDRFDSMIVAAPAYWIWLTQGSSVFGG